MADTARSLFFDTNPADINFLKDNGDSIKIKQKHEGACVTIGSYLVYAFCDEHDDIHLASCNLANFAASRKVSSIRDWRVSKLADAFPGHQKLSFKSKYALALVASAGSFFLFWEDNTNSRDAAVRGTPDLTDLLSTEYTFTWRDPSLGNLLRKVSGARTAVVAPDGESIVVGQFAVATSDLTAYGVNIAAMVFHTNQLRPADFRAFSAWSGSADITLISQDPSKTDGFSDTIGMAWFTQGALAEGKEGDSRDQISTTFYLILSCCKGGNEALSYAWQIDDVGLPWSSSPRKHASGRSLQTATPVKGPLGEGGKDKVKFGASVVRDPVGRVLAYWCNKNSEIGYSWFLPNTVDTKSGLFSPQWSAMTILKLENGKAHQIGNRPCVGFVALPEQLGGSVQLPKPDGSKTQQTYADCPQQTLIAFLLVRDKDGDAKNLQLMTSTLGTSLMVSGYNVLPPTSSRVLASLVADTFPYPVPLPDVYENISPSGMVNWLCCSYEYLTGDEVSEATETIIENMFGIKAGTTGGSMMAEGSIASGFRDLTSSSRTVTTSMVYNVITKGIPGPLAAPSFSITPYGAVFGREYPTLEQDIAVFLDREDKTYIQASNPIEQKGLHIPDQHRIRVSGKTVSGARASQFTTYCYTPGDLRTYTPERINSRVSNLYSRKSVQMAPDLKIGGQDYSHFYAPPDKDGRGYFERIVEEYGANCFGPDRNLSYIEFTMSATGMQRAEYQDTSEFTSAGSFLLDSSAYAGLRLALSVSVGFALVVDVSIGTDGEMYAMAGWEMQTELTNRTSKSSGWGVRIPEFLNPLAPGEAYTVRMYFLKPSPLWALEMKHFGNDPALGDVTIDHQHSLPVRIMFTVPYRSHGLDDNLQRVYGNLPALA